MTSSQRKLLNTAQSKYEFRTCPTNGSRSPCPALNSLANHGFISRDGKNLAFMELVHAMVLVYNLTYPLAFLLAIVGFVTCGHISLSRPPRTTTPKMEPSGFLRRSLSVVLRPINTPFFFYPRLVLDLSSLSSRGKLKITHDAAFVHPDSIPSVTPDVILLEDLLQYASQRRHESFGDSEGGLSYIDIAKFHARRVKNAPRPLSSIHQQISLGECALTWEALRGYQCHSGSDAHDRRTYSLKGGLDGVIPVSRLRQWFGEERLPDGWWDDEGVRPHAPIGIIEARLLADLMGKIASEN
ncbi:hypothetical protein JR316_0010691 [Psilocybe cubensis]|uniref:Uncharacterized protein n=2 Tax=Psilocybe cubensis TaxID=181762 RepID=A0ACB8GMJ3_PSICU|nr:hypothetical protein JR316_0010691 [Psilocybe cubensis]KAH9476776.1 hypothetical protein JR316_0010691 [Psilocybe cubensis]